MHEAHAIRSAGGRSHNNGNNAQELRDGAKEAIGVTLDAIAVEEIPDRLRAGYAVTAGLQYGDLPDYLRVQNGDFGHAVCLYRWRGRRVSRLLRSIVAAGSRWSVGALERCEARIMGRWESFIDCANSYNFRDLE